MRLRTELWLVFGVVIFLVAGVIVWVSSGITDSALRREKGRFTPRAFKLIREAEARRMYDAFARLTGQSPDPHSLGLNVVRNQLKSFLSGAGEEKKALLREVQKANPRETAWLVKAVRGEEGGPPLSEAEALRFDAWANLRSLYVESSGFLGDDTTGPTEFELLVIADPSGLVLVESLMDAERNPPRMPGADEPLPLPHLGDLSKVVELKDLGTEVRTGYILYPDGLSENREGLTPYYVLWAMDYFEHGGERGLLLLGNRMDDAFAEEASLVTADAEVRIVADGRVVSQSPSQGRDDLSDALEAYLARPEAQAIVGDYLSKVAPNESAEADVPPGVFDLRVGKYLVRPLPLSDSWGKQFGHVFFMKSLADIQNEVTRQIRSILYVGAGSFVLCLLLVPFWAGRFTRPIDRLAARMVGVPQGELTELEDSEISGSIEVRQASRAFNQMITGLRQKEVLEGYVPIAAREQIETGRGAAPEIGGTRVHATILFSDLRGFTSLSEKIAPDEVMTLLSEYLDRMTMVIRSYTGDINEYIGDAILAVFKDREGVRSEQLAVRAALDMNRALDELKGTTDNPHLKEMRQGIGIHSGELVEGNIGTRSQEKEEKRWKLAVVGDTVNLAARIQDRSRDGKSTCILVSETAKNQLPSWDFQLEFFGNESFKGKSQPVPVWEVVGGPSRAWEGAW